MKSPLRTLLLFGLLFAALFAGIAAIERMIGPAYSRALLRQVETGMTKQQVRDILGPTSSAANESTWIYERSGNLGYVQVAFDQNNRVLYVNDESVFPPRK